MSESWSLLKGVLEDGSQALIMADAAYSSPQARGGREILLVVTFPGTYMMQAADRRDAVLDHIAPFLSDHDGGHVAGITLLGTSYAFLFYLGGGAERHEVPIPPECADIARVWLAYDPYWMEYSSFVVSTPRGLLERLHSWWSMRAIERAPRLEASSVDEYGVEDVLRALASSGSNLAKSTDIVFQLYVPTREDADTCYCALWEHGFRARVGIPSAAMPDGTSERRWSVTGNLDAVPAPATIREACKIMEELANDCGAEFAGWRAAYAPGARR